MIATRRTNAPALRVLSYGGGLDSTTLLLLSHHGELPKLDCAIFSDTQSEPQGVYETLEWVTAAVGDAIPIHRVSVGNLGENTLAVAQRHANGEHFSAAQHGQPPFWVRNDPNKNYATADSGGQLWRKCTHDYKIVPIRQKIRELLGVKTTGRLPKDVWVEQWIGFPKDELQRTFCSDVQWITNTFPLILPARMSKRDCAAWLTAQGYPIPVKSSCTFCPYHSNIYWRDMRDTRPKEWATTVEFEQRLQAGRLPGVRGIPYLHKSMVPLPLAVIDEQDNGPELFCLACGT